MHDETEARRSEVLRVFAASPNPMSVATVVDVENGLILTTAMQAYVKGVDVAAVITGHASAERDLLIRASHWAERREPEPPRKFEMWGLGRLIDYYRSELKSDLLSSLSTLNIRRRTLYHYGHSQTASGLNQSTHAYIAKHGTGSLVAEYSTMHGQRPDQKELFEHSTRTMLRGWALDSLETALAARAWAIG